MDEVLGLPAHPLLVHAPVILVPLAFGGAVVAVVWRRYRRELLFVVAGLALVGGVTAFLAAGAGESLEDRLEDAGQLTESEEERIEDHESAGQRAEWASIAFAVVALGAAGAEIARGRSDGSRGGGWSNVVTAVAVGSLVVGGVATATVILAGHSGAKAVWEDDAPGTNPDDRDGDDDSDNRGPGS